MSRKTVLSVLLLIIASVAVAPALQACETCWPANMKDPSGGTSDKIRCYVSSDGVWELCTVKPDYSGCNLDDTDPNACPASTSTGGGTSGGGSGTGSGGSTCSTRATGSCPSDCWDCGGGGMLY